MEYNSQRDKLIYSDYGRNVHKLIAYAKTIEDRTQRTKVAEAIVSVMAMVNPKVREQSEWHRKLWDHLMIISNWELDVDCPYELERETDGKCRPENLSYRSRNIHYRHYGRNLEQMILKVSEMEDGAEKNVLTEMIAHTMKRHYLTWNRDTVDDTMIVSQLGEMSGNAMQLREDFLFDQDYSAAPQQPNPFKKKKKKKKTNRYADKA